MILQKDKRYTIEPLKKYGCYFHCIAFLANKYNNYPLSVGEMERRYKEAVILNHMDEDCYIKHPDDIFRLFGLPVVYEGKFSPTYASHSNEKLEILCYRRTYSGGTYSHFVVGDGFGHVAYDPMGDSNAVKLGYLDSKRIFRRL